MSKITYFTKEGLKKLNDELHHLKTKGRADIAKQIAEARDKGDLSENAEYDAAKDAQGLHELKISKLGESISNARIIDESDINTDKVSILSKVKIENLNLKKEFQYTIVSEEESNLEDEEIRKIFYKSDSDNARLTQEKDSGSTSSEDLEELGF